MVVVNVKALLLPAFAYLARPVLFGKHFVIVGLGEPFILTRQLTDRLSGVVIGFLLSLQGPLE